MNLHRTFQLTTLALAFLAQAASAQTASTPASLGSTASPTLSVNTPLTISPAVLNQAMSAADAAAKAGDLATAEARLTSLNFSTPNTAEWHMETAARFIQLASGLARESSIKAVLDSAQTAIVHLETARGLTSDASTKATSDAAKGFIYDRFLGNTTSAIEAYKLAASENPKDQTIKNALTWLQSADANLRAKIHAPQP